MFDHDIESNATSSQMDFETGLRMRFNALINDLHYVHDLSQQNSTPKQVNYSVTSNIHRFSTCSLWSVTILILVTYCSCPRDLGQGGKPTVQHVWYFGWICALASGFGVLPLVCAPNMNKLWMGVSNGR